MKKFKSILAAIVAATLMFGVVSCSKDSTAETTLAPGETTVAGETTAANTLDLSEYSYDSIYGSQLPGYLDRQYYFDGTAIPVAESNFYLIDAFLELTKYATYGYYPSTTEGYIDLSTTLDSEDSEYSTYGEFFLSYAERMLESTYVINQMAAEAGLELSDDTLQEIEETITSIEASSATPAGMTMDEYLQLYYGPSCNVEVFRTIIKNYKLADLYTQSYIDNYEFEDSDLYIPNVRYVLISAPEGTDEEAMTTAEETANEILEASTDLGQLEIQGALAYTNGTATESSVIGVERGTVVSAFEEWSYDESREEGDIDLIYAPEYGYFVVGYEGTTEISDSSKENFCVAALGDEVTALIEAGEYEFYSNDPIVAAQPVVAETADGTAVAADGTTTAATTQSATNQSTTFIVIGSILGVLGVGGIVAAFVLKKSPAKSDDDDEDEDAEGGNDNNDDNDDADENADDKNESEDKE